MIPCSKLVTRGALPYKICTYLASQLIITRPRIRIILELTLRACLANILFEPIHWKLN